MRHVEVLLLQPQVVMVVVITSTGAVTKRVFAFDRAVDSGLCEWAGAFLNDRIVGLTVGSRLIEARLEDPSLSPMERAFLAVLAPAIVDLDDGAAGSIFVGGRARFLAEQRHLDLMAIDSLMESLEERYALLALLRGALSRNQVYLRIGAELPTRASRGSAWWRPTTVCRAGTWAPSRCSGPPGWTTGSRWRPSAGRPRSCRGTWRTLSE